MKIYRTTKGQLIAIWFFGLIGLVYAADQSSYSDLAGVLAILIPAILVVYTIGWRAQHRKKEAEEISSLPILKSKSFRKARTWLLIGLLFIVVFSIGGSVYLYFAEKSAAREEYVGSINRYGQVLNNAETCVKESVEVLKAGRIASCNEKFNAAHAAYKNCKANLPFMTHYDCLRWGNSNYEQYDCSEETVMSELESGVKTSCYEEAVSQSTVIKNYEKRIVREFIDSYPKSKASFSQAEIQKLYALFPSEVFNEKTKERLLDLIIDAGYTVQ